MNFNKNRTSHSIKAFKDRIDIIKKVKSINKISATKSKIDLEADDSMIPDEFVDSPFAQNSPILQGITVNHSVFPCYESENITKDKSKSNQSTAHLVNFDDIPVPKTDIFHSGLEIIENCKDKDNSLIDASRETNKDYRSIIDIQNNKNYKIVISFSSETQKSEIGFNN